MTAPLRVRTAAPEDATAVRRICVAGWRHAYDGLLPPAFIEANVRTFYRVAALREEIREPGAAGAWHIAERGGEPVGAGRGTVPRRGYCELFNLYVHPDAQGAGVGTALVEAITDRQTDSGGHTQLVATYEDHDALNFYRYHGFERLGTHPGRAVDGVDPGRRTVWLARDV